jgi:nucleoside-diphosphate-sugar epimerase
MDSAERVSPMKIFVTGSTGFVGSHLVDRLLERGDKVACLVRETSNLRWLSDKPVKLVYGDLRGEPGPELEKALKEADCVYHVAGAVMGVQREDYFQVNAKGTRNLLDALVRAGATPKRFLLVSSIAAGGPGDGETPVREDRPPHPVSWYGESKLEGERIARSYETHFPVTIVRPSVVFGPRDPGMLPTFSAIRKGLNLVLGRGVKTNFVYVSDIVTGLILAAESDQSVGEVLNIGASENIAAAQALRRMAEAVGRKTITVRVPLFLGYAMAGLSELRVRITRRPYIFNWQKMAELRETNWMIDVTRARELIGFEPEVSLEEGGRITYNWYLERGWI